MSVESNEVKGCFVQSQVTLNLLLFTVSFTIFLEIEFDFIFYLKMTNMRYASPAQNLRYDFIGALSKVVIIFQRW